MNIRFNPLPVNGVVYDSMFDWNTQSGLPPQLVNGSLFFSFNKSNKNELFKYFDAQQLQLLFSLHVNY